MGVKGDANRTKDFDSYNKNYKRIFKRYGKCQTCKNGKHCEGYNSRTQYCPDYEEEK